MRHRYQPPQPLPFRHGATTFHILASMMGFYVLYQETAHSEL